MPALKAVSGDVPVVIVPPCHKGQVDPGFAGPGSGLPGLLPKGYAGDPIPSEHRIAQIATQGMESPESPIPKERHWQGGKQPLSTSSLCVQDSN